MKLETTGTQAKEIAKEIVRIRQRRITAQFSLGRKVERFHDIDAH